MSQTFHLFDIFKIKLWTQKSAFYENGMTSWSHVTYPRSRFIFLFVFFFQKLVDILQIASESGLLHWNTIKGILDA